MDWRLFGAVYYFKATPAGVAEEPHGYIELSPTFRAALQSRGLFRLGFDAKGLAALELHDAFGQMSVVRFTSFERNPKLAPSFFEFVPPKGADVIGDTK